MRKSKSVPTKIKNEGRSSKWRLDNEFECQFSKREPQSEYLEVSSDVESQIETDSAKYYAYCETDSLNRPSTSSKSSPSNSDIVNVGERLRVKKWTKTQKSHRAVRSNDCQFMPKVETGKNLHISARNYNRILARQANRTNVGGCAVAAYAGIAAGGSNGAVLTSNNVGGIGVNSDLANFLLTLQDREITPEDYEILLQLDLLAVEEKKKKAGRIVQRLRSEILSDETVYNNEQCVICLENYSEGEKVKNLLCGHRFHSDCLNDWMSNSGSTTCPLDNINIYEMKPQIDGRVSEPTAPLFVVTLAGNVSEQNLPSEISYKEKMSFKSALESMRNMIRNFNSRGEISLFTIFPNLASNGKANNINILLVLIFFRIYFTFVSLPNEFRVQFRKNALLKL